MTMRYINQHSTSDTVPQVGRKSVPQVQTDIASHVIAGLVRWRSRLPGWQLQVLERLSEAEASSVVLLKAAHSAVTDSRLRGLLARHIEDEEKHARLFGERWQARRADAGLPYAELPSITLEVGDRMSVLELMALFEVGELRGFQAISQYPNLFSNDPETVRTMEIVCKDERFHAGYVHQQMERWSQDGWGIEVEAARSVARRSDRRAFYREMRAFLAVLPRLLAWELGRLFRLSEPQTD